MAAGLPTPNDLMNKLSALGVIRGAHWAAHGLLTRAGYRWELRRSGELKLGLWRKALTERKSETKKLVLVPGFGDTPMSWWTVLGLLRPVIRNHYDEIVLMDFPGFGGFLSQEKSFHSMDLLRGAVFDAFDSLKPHTILGHSLGGWLAGAYGVACGQGERPTNKSKYTGPDLLVLANPSGATPSREVRSEFEIKFRRAAEEGFEFLRPHVFGHEPFWFKYFAREFARFIHKDDVKQFMASVREDHWLEEKLSAIQARVWLLWGEDDSLVPADCAEAWLKKLAPPAERPAHAVLLKRVGHSPQVESPAVTAAALGQILLGQVPHSVGKHWWRVIP